MNNLNSVFVVEYEVINPDNFFELPVGTIVYGAGYDSCEFTEDINNCNTYNNLDDIKEAVDYIREPHTYGGKVKYHYGLKVKIREIYRSMGKEIMY